MAAVVLPVRRPARRAGDRAVVPAGLPGCGASPPGPGLPDSSAALSFGLLLFFTLAMYKVTTLEVAMIAVYT